jgi:hypothetical protein
MAKQVLTIEYDFDFTLYGISCHEKDYRLSWSLNKGLNIDLAKTADYLIETKKQKEGLNYSSFSFEDSHRYLHFFLLSNKSLQGPLLPEQKQADFLLLIKGNLNPESKALLLKEIKASQDVLTAFEINPNSLKSKENLLF